MPTGIVEHHQRPSANQEIKRIMNIGILGKDELLVDLLKIVLEFDGHRATHISSPNVLLEQANQQSQTVEKLHLLLVNREGIDLEQIVRIKTTHPALPLLLLTDEVIGTSQAIKKNGSPAIDIVEKPFKVTQLLTLIHERARK